MELLKIIEIVSTVTGILCVYFQTKERIIAWPLGMISVALATFIFWDAKLYSDLILHVIFFILNIYGWYVWLNKDEGNNLRAIEILSPLNFVWAGITIFIGTAVWGKIMQSNTDANLPFFDAFTTIGSLTAQFLLARKVLQNWLIWIVVDIVAIYIYIQKDLQYFAFLFFVYLILSAWGYWNWRRSLTTKTT